MRNFKLHKRTKLLCIVSGDIKKQQKESNEEEREERRSCSDKLLWRLNKIQIRKCLRRKNERFGAQIKTHELGTVWLTHSSLSLLLFLLLFFYFLFSVLYRSKISFLAEMAGTNQYNLISEAVRIRAISVLVWALVQKILAGQNSLPRL